MLAGRRSGLGPSFVDKISLPVLSRSTGAFSVPNETAYLSRNWPMGFCEMTNIYVGNLSYRASEEDLREAFSRYGAVTSVQIITDRETGRSRGFAFVEMPNADEAKQAIDQLDSADIAGRAVRVNEAKPRD